jgi:tRNA-intron endonuclease
MAGKKKKSAQATLIETFAGQKEEPEPEIVLPKEEPLEELSPLLESKPSESKEKSNSAEKKNGKKKLVNGILVGEKVITESSDESREFYNQSRFGNLAENGKVELSLLEAYYLMEKGKLSIKTDTRKKLTPESFLKKATELEPNFWIRYCVFRDIRNRGYIIKTALKFGADFRVYDRGVKPGEDHARWIVYPVHEGDTLTWYEFAAKNRVAHSTKKRLLMAIVDDEGDCTYYEIKWVRP